jgi:AraC-like DNA-binding protein
MWQDFSHSASRSGAAEITLRSIWDVEGDEGYDAQRRKGEDSLLAIYTHEGHGKLHFGDERALDVQGGTLILFPYPTLRRYRCVGGVWRFWWFEFSVGDAIQFPLDEVMKISSRRKDESDFQEIFSLLRRPSPMQGSLASASFAKLLYDWLCRRESKQGGSPHQGAIEALVDQLHGDLSVRWTVAEMARVCHLSERRFRQVFEKIMGDSPKRFYDALRLDRAEDLLRIGIYSVSQVATLLGYSSPFHLSKAFRARFGVPPSRIGKAS